MMRFAAVALSLMFGAANGMAQEAGLIGNWSATIYGITDKLMIGPGGRYTETAYGPGGVTQEIGDYSLFDQNVISFHPFDWFPKTRSVYHPRGTVGGYMTQEPVAPPPGNTCQFRFDGPGLLVMRCQSLPGATIVYRRQ